MNGAVKRAHDETKVMENKYLLQQQQGGQQQQQQQVMAVEAGDNAGETRPSKVARHEREADVKQGHELPLPVFHNREIPSLETGVREAITATTHPQQQPGRESKLQMRVVQQQQAREFAEDRVFVTDKKVERDAQGMRVSGKPAAFVAEVGKDLRVGGGASSSSGDIRALKVQDSNRGLGQEATGGNGDLIPDVATRKSPPEQENKLWEMQEASGENRVEGSKEEREKGEQEREKKDEMLRERNDTKEETHEHSSLPEPKGCERDQREREQAETEKEKDKMGDKDQREREKGETEKEKDKMWDKGKGTSRDKRDKREKEGDKELNHQGKLLDQEDTHEKEEINAIIKEQELGRTAGEGIESRKHEEKEGREVERREGEKREEDWDIENKRKRMWESEKDRQLAGGSPERRGMGERQRDRDTVVNHNVQHRARLLRPRRHSSPAPRELRTYPRVKENEVTHGPSESSALLYRIGQGMPKLTMLQKDYEAKAATVATESNSPSQAGFTVDIQIPADLATTSNRQIRGRQLWGTDIYTDDSDIVAVLMHTGYYTPVAIPPPRCVSELQATIRILPPQETYTSMLRNSLRSRAWGGGSGCSYRVERCQIIKVGGGSVELQPCLTRTPAVAPTLAPAASERTVTTRAACSNAYLQQRLVREVTIQYNLCNEPWLKYSMSIVADHGLKKSQYTSARLKKGDVLYVETHRHRYELAYSGNGATCNGIASAATATSAPPQASATPEKAKEKAGYSERAQGKGCSSVHNGERVHPDSHPPNGEKNGQGHSTKTHNGDSCERYRWSRCLWPLPLSDMRIKGVPSPPDNVEVLQDGLAWEEVKWSPTSVWVRGVEYCLARAQFLSDYMDQSGD